MPDFSRLPGHVKDQVAQQMKFKDCVNFGKSSKVTASVFKRTKVFVSEEEVNKVQIVHLNEEIYIRFPTTLLEESRWYRASELPAIHFVGQEIILKGVICDAYCKDLAAFFRRVGATNTKLRLWQCGRNYCRFSSAAFCDVLEAADAQEFGSTSEMPSSLLCDLPEKLASIDVKSPVNDNEVMKIKVPRMEFYYSDIGNVGLNGLLKEWSAGQRTIEKIKVNTRMRIAAEEVLMGIHHEKAEESSLWILNNGHQRLFCIINQAGWGGLFRVCTERKNIY